MGRLLDLLYSNRNLFIFIGLELLAFLLLVNFNKKQKGVMADLSLSLSGQVQALSASLNSYFSLEEKNEALLRENILLRKQLTETQRKLGALSFVFSDSAPRFRVRNDSTMLGKYNFLYLPCRTLYNTTHSTYNHFVINIGRKQGVKEEMGVVSNEGIAGMVVNVSENYALAMSLLNQNFRVSARIKGHNIRGTFMWRGLDTRFGNLEYIPQHYQIRTGDTVITSSYSTIFPEGYILGIVQSAEPKETDGFFDIKVRLMTDFHKLDYVYLVQNEDKASIDSLIKTAK